MRVRKKVIKRVSEFPRAVPTARGQTADGPAPYRKQWLTREEYAAADDATRALYAPAGDEYRLRVMVDPRQQRIAMFVMLALAVVFGALGIFATLADHWTLEILAYCGAMPSLFGFLVQLASYLSWR
jgi:hypothetical protein